MILGRRSESRCIFLNYNSPCRKYPFLRILQTALAPKFILTAVTSELVQYLSSVKMKMVFKDF